MFNGDDYTSLSVKYTSSLHRKTGSRQADSDFCSSRLTQLKDTKRLPVEESNGSQIFLFSLSPADCIFGRMERGEERGERKRQVSLMHGRKREKETASLYTAYLDGAKGKWQQKVNGE